MKTRTLKQRNEMGVQNECRRGFTGTAPPGVDSIISEFENSIKETMDDDLHFYQRLGYLSQSSTPVM